MAWNGNNQWEWDGNRNENKAKLGSGNGNGNEPLGMAGNWIKKSFPLTSTLDISIKITRREEARAIELQSI